MRLHVKVLPRSSKNEIVGEMADGVLKIKLTVAPVDGKANKELIALLSAHFKRPQKNITIISGTTSPRKIIEIL